MTRGKFIVIDGGEGAGKSTLVNYARELFPNLIVTREPGGSPFAEKIRTLILSDDAKDAHGETQFGLFWAARFDHVVNLIAPAVRAGKHVLSDRFDSSSYVYQIYGQEARHLEKLFWQVREIYLQNCKPDLYIYLDVKPEEGIKRATARKGEFNHFDARKMDFHNRLREGYFNFLKFVPHKTIDTNRPIDKVKADFKNILDPLFT